MICFVRKEQPIGWQEADLRKANSIATAQQLFDKFLSSPLRFIALYIGLIFAFPLIYLSQTDGFYHSNITLEQSFGELHEHLQKLLLEDISGAFIDDAYVDQHHEDAFLSDDQLTYLKLESLTPSEIAFDLYLTSVTNHAAQEKRRRQHRFQIVGRELQAILQMGKRGELRSFPWRMDYSYAGAVERTQIDGDAPFIGYLRPDKYSRDLKPNSLNCWLEEPIPWDPCEEGESRHVFLLLSDDTLLTLYELLSIHDGASTRGWEGYLRYLYFSAVTATTLGFGDIAPISRAARAWVTIQVILSILVFGVFLNALSSRKR